MSVGAVVTLRSRYRTVCPGTRGTILDLVGDGYALVEFDGGPRPLVVGFERLEAWIL